MDEVFKALADAGRRQLLDSLNARDGQSLRELCAGLDMTRQSVSKHLSMLEHANLVTTARRGREKLHYLNAAPINAIAERWIKHFDRDRLETGERFPPSRDGIAPPAEPPRQSAQFGEQVITPGREHLDRGRR